MWKYKRRSIKCLKDFPEDCYGFIYKIHNLTNGKTYIGEKQLFSVTNPRISKKKYDLLKSEGIPVRRQKDKRNSKKGSVVWIYKQKELKKETNWLDYCGSSDELTKDIENGHEIKKEILEFTFSKREHTYKEVKHQILNDVLEDCNSYNGNILAKFFKQIECQ